MDQEPHAHLSIKLFHGLKGDRTVVEFKGCETHFIEAFANMLHEDEELKRIVNKATKRANEKRQKEQN